MAPVTPRRSLPAPTHSGKRAPYRRPSLQSSTGRTARATDGKQRCQRLAENSFCCSLICHHPRRGPSSSGAINAEIAVDLINLARDLQRMPSGVRSGSRGRRFSGAMRPRNDEAAARIEHGLCRSAGRPISSREIGVDRPLRFEIEITHVAEPDVAVGSGRSWRPCVVVTAPAMERKGKQTG